MVEAIRQLQERGSSRMSGRSKGSIGARTASGSWLRRGRNGRDKVGCIVLGRGEDEKKVREWLTVAAGVPGFIGFAVGRTVFWDPLVNWRAGKITREAAAARSPTVIAGWPRLSKKRVLLGTFMPRRENGADQQEKAGAVKLQAATQL